MKYQRSKTLVDRNATSNPLVTLDFPAPLQQRVINALKADPRTVDLRAQAPHFYSLGAKMLEMFEDDDMVDVLMDVSLNTATCEQGVEQTMILIICSYRHSRNEQLKSLIMHITQRERWEKEQNFSEDLMRRNDSCFVQLMRARRQSRRG